MNRIALIISLALVVGCADRAAQKSAKKTAELVNDRTIPVRVTASTKRTIDDELTVTGAFTTSEQSNVSANVGGRIVAVYVRDGDQVKAGQAIAQQETTDLYSRLSQARSQAQAARSQLQQAQSDAAVGPTKSTSNLRASEARLAQAQARYTKAKNGSRSEERVQAEWSVRRAKSDLETAKIARDRAQKLYAEGAVARVDVENAENRYSNALAAYEAALQNQSMVISATRPEDLMAAKQDVEAAEQAVRIAKADKSLDVVLAQRVEAARANLRSALDAVTIASKALADTTVRSPFSGRVSGKSLQPGTYAAPGTPIVTIVGTGGSYFEANVPENKVAQVLPGAEVDVTVDALNNLRLTGTVMGVNPMASGQGRVYTVRIAVQESVQVKPGMFARGVVRLGKRAGVVTVPIEAIVRDGESAYVFIVEGNSAKKVDVKLGLRSGPYQEVSGLEQGKKVVTEGQNSLVNGTTVKVEGDK